MTTNTQQRPDVDRHSFAVDRVDPCGPGAWASGVDHAGIIHDLVVREDRAGATTRCGRTLAGESVFHPHLVARRLRARGVNAVVTPDGRWASVPELAAEIGAPHLSVPIGMCSSCARWRAGHEERIVWRDGVDLEQLDYVRVWEAPTPRRSGRPAWSAGSTTELLGWSELGPGARSRGGMFLRRVFVLKAHDRRVDDVLDGPYRPCGLPVEAVDPRTLGPNRAGEITSRALGREIAA